MPSVTCRDSACVPQSYEAKLVGTEATVCASCSGGKLSYSRTLVVGFLLWGVAWVTGVTSWLIAYVHPVAEGRRRACRASSESLLF